MHDLAGDELGDRQSDDLSGLVDIGDDPPYLRAGQSAGFGAEAEHDLVTAAQLFGNE